MRRLRNSIKSSPVVRTLLSERNSDGEIPHHPYSKWDGAHWVLSMLADLGYPPDDVPRDPRPGRGSRGKSLIPLREQEFGWLYSNERSRRIIVMRGRVRRCASMEGNALYALHTLGLADDRADRVAASLIEWQWPDGGWNCDKHPEAHCSSFTESLIPLRGLAAHARATGDPATRRAVERAAEVFLSRQLFKRRSSGRLISDHFAKLHHPCYWHYDILFALKVLSEAGFLSDPRCRKALDLLESKRLPDGGFPAEARYYLTSPRAKTGRSIVDWGGTSTSRMNPFVTADALIVLHRAGRLPLPARAHSVS